MPAEQRTAWLGRLTHLNCSLNPGIKAVPAQLEHATALRELDLSYCNKLQISMEAADMLAELTRCVGEQAGWPGHAGPRLAPCVWGSPSHPRAVLLLLAAQSPPLCRRLPCSLSMLRLGKSYWLKQTDRWTPASMKAIRRLQKARPDLSIDYQHPGGNAAAW